MEEVEIKPKSVTELTEYIKTKFEEDEYFQSVLVEGEISNYKRHFSGHLYFTLKDENAVIKCVMFKFNTYNLDFEPKDGEKVIVLRKDICISSEWSISNLCSSYKEIWNR